MLGTGTQDGLKRVVCPTFICFAVGSSPLCGGKSGGLFTLTATLTASWTLWAPTAARVACHPVSNTIQRHMCAGGLHISGRGSMREDSWSLTHHVQLRRSNCFQGTGLPIGHVQFIKPVDSIQPTVWKNSVPQESWWSVPSDLGSHGVHGRHRVCTCETNREC